MKRDFLSLGLALSAAFVQTGELIAANMPQDSWSYYGKKLSVPDSIQKKGIAIGGASIFVGVTTSSETTAIQKYALDGAYVSTLSTTFTDVTGMACDSSGNLYVFDRGQAELKAFDNSGSLLWSIGSAGTGQGQFSTTAATSQHAHLAIDETDKLYVLDRGNSRVQRFDKQGNFETLWGTAGTSSNQYSSPFGIAAKNGQVVVVDSPGGNRQRLQAFQTNGDYLASRGWPSESNTIIANERLAYTPDGLLSTTGAGIGISNQGPLYDQTLATVATLQRPSDLATNSTNRLGAAFTPSGDLWMINGGEVRLLERRYASTDNPVVRTALPQPEVIKVAQRPASTLLDIDFKVNDPDSATVDVAALAFVNGTDTLADVLRISTLVEGTDVNIGPGQATNTSKRITWNAAADWSSEFGEVQVEILAKDQRNLLGVHWITVPANGGTPAFQASAKPLDDPALLSLWYWLIAKGDPEIVLVNGEVKAVGGALDGQTLASGITTTSEGRLFLNARLGVRAITTGELTSLQSGNYGFASSNTLTVVKP